MTYVITFYSGLFLFLEQFKIHSNSGHKVQVFGTFPALPFPGSRIISVYICCNWWSYNAQIYSLKLINFMKITLYTIYFMGFWRYIMTWIYHYTMTHNGFLALTVFRSLLLVYSFLSAKPLVITDILCLKVLLLFQTSYTWSHTICDFFKMAFLLNNIHLPFLCLLLPN